MAKDKQRSLTRDFLSAFSVAIEMTSKVTLEHMIVGERFENRCVKWKRGQGSHRLTHLNCVSHSVGNAMAKYIERLRKFYHENKPLIPLKIAVFCFYGGIFSLLPFLSVHMKSLGLSLKQTTVIYAVLVLSSFVGSPIAGYLSDKTGRFKLILSLTLITTGILHTCLLFIPPSWTPTTRPVSSRFVCSISGSYLLMDFCNKYERQCHLNNTAHGYRFHSRSCREICPLNHVNANIEPSSKVCFGKQRKSTCPIFNQYMVSPSNFSLSQVPIIYNELYMCVHRLESVSWMNEERTEMYCPGKAYTCRVECDVHVVDNENSTLVCQNENNDADSTFYSYFVLRFFCMLTLSASYPLIEAAILIQSKKYKGEYGKQRVWSNIAMSICTPVAGLLIDAIAAHHSGATSYFPAFIIFDVLLIVTMLVVVYSLEIEMESQPKLHIHHVIQICHVWEALLLYLAVFFLGAIWGFLETFLFWFLIDIGSTKLLLGFSKTVGSIICIPTMFFADAICDRVGRANILIASFMCYALQLLSYSLIGNPWWAVGLELFKFMTSCLKIAASVTLANSLAPKGLVTTMQSVVRCLQYEIGSGVGVLLGGLFADWFGFRATFRILGVTSAILAILYAIGHYKLTSKNTPCAGVITGASGNNENETAI